jgi:hypothetical protein
MQCKSNNEAAMMFESVSVLLSASSKIEDSVLKYQFENY